MPVVFNVNKQSLAISEENASVDNQDRSADADVKPTSRVTSYFNKVQDHINIMGVVTCAMIVMSIAMFSLIGIHYHGILQHLQHSLTPVNTLFVILFQMTVLGILMQEDSL